MSSIQILPDNVSNKIAAGEVIERPASVVKELVENALDAHATKIAVRIERAGTRLISVSDNGDGMDPDDAMLCFEQHATSKIRSEEDILHIASFGFRGEAMPSIASISRMTVRTRRKESREGFQVSVNGGIMANSEPVGCAPGTETTVRELFFNVPARRKFLKSNATEERHIIETISVISLAHPETAFELVVDGRIVIASGGAPELMPRIRDIFGRDLADAMIRVEKQTALLRVDGYITKRGVTRPTRQEQRIFVNARPVDALPVYRGIREGCGPMLEKGRYQPAVLFLTLDPTLVDVNVHPAKREVRFRNEFEIVATIRDAVAEAVARAARLDNPFLNPDAYVRTSDPSNPAEKSPFSHPVSADGEEHPGEKSQEQSMPEKNVSRMSLKNVILSAKIDYRPISVRTPSVPPSPDLFTPKEIETPEEPAAASVPSPSNSVPEAASSLKNREFPVLNDLKVLGFLENTYIVATMPDGLVLIDQHAAHERVLFERITHRAGQTLSQRLLIPITLELSRADCAFIDKNREIFETLGFDADGMGGNTVKLNTIPAALKQDNAGGMFREILSILTEDGTFGGRTDAAALAKAACTAAVKAHDVLTPEECGALLAQMAQCELPFCCPHGRPTIINISIRELERRFGRKI